MKENHRGSLESLPAKAAEPADVPAPHPAAEPPFRPDFAVVDLRHRHDGWTPERQRAFIEALADTLSVAAAAERVGMTEQSVYQLRRRRGAEGFSAAWDAALIHGIRSRAVSRAAEMALNGRVVRRYYHGQLISEEVVHSERLILALLDKGEKLLTAAQPEAACILADWDGAMERLEQGKLGTGRRVWRNERGQRMTDFPPPDGYAGYAEGEPGEPGYCRRLTESEEAALDQALEGAIEEGESARDSFFGFTPGRRRADRENRVPGR